MYDLMLNIHKIAATLFLLIYLFKLAMVLARRREQLTRAGRKIRLIEIPVSVLFLATGIYLLVEMGGLPGWMHPKLTAIVIAIPLAVIGLKKNNGILLTLAVLLLVYIYGVSETKNPALFAGKKAEAAAEGDIGKALYSMHCVQCHGDDGKLGLYESPDLTLTKMSREEKTAIIANGKKLMMPFGSRLTKEDIEAVADYMEELKGSSKK